MTNTKKPKVSLHFHTEEGDLPGISSEFVSHYVPSKTIALNYGKYLKTGTDGRRIYTFRRGFNACRDRLTFNHGDVYFLRLYKQRRAVEKTIKFIEEYFKKNSLEVEWDFVDVVNKPERSRMTYLRYEPKGGIHQDDVHSIKYMLGLITNTLSFKPEVILNSNCIKDIFDQGLPNNLGDKYRMISRRLFGDLLPSGIHSHILCQEVSSKLLPQVFNYLLERNPWEDTTKSVRDIRKIVENHTESRGP